MNRKLPVAAILPLLILATACSSVPTAPEPHIMADRLLQRAHRADSLGRSAEAEELLQEALKISGSVEDLSIMAETRVSLARIQRRAGALGQASASIDGALSLITPATAAYAEAAYEKGLVELALGKPENALEWAKIAAEGEEQRGRRLNLVGRILLQQGDLPSELLHEALSENRREENREEEANSLRMLGIGARRKGDLTASERFLTEALELDKKVGQSGKIATDLEELAATARAGGRSEDAIRYLKRAAGVHQSASRCRPTEAVWESLAELYAARGELRAAEEARRLGKSAASGCTGPAYRSRDGKSATTTIPSSNP